MAPSDIAPRPRPERRSSSWTEARPSPTRSTTWYHSRGMDGPTTLLRSDAMPIATRLTELLGIKHPIVLAPMDLVSDGRLAATVSRAGGFGMIGGGYGDQDWLERELKAAGDARVGVGFITRGMARRPACPER